MAILTTQTHGQLGNEDERISDHEVEKYGITRWLIRVTINAEPICRKAAMALGS